MTTSIDLQQLVHNRGPAAPRPRRATMLTRFVVPGLILVGYLGLLGWASRDMFSPAKSVTVVPVVITRAEVQTEGEPLFRAAGWIEPRPLQTLVPALAEGIVAELMVVEGQSVEAGQPLARLVDADAKLALEQAQSQALLAQTDIQSAQAELNAAQQRLENPVHIEAVVSEAQSLLARTETELSRMPLLIEAARARTVFTQQNLEGKQSAVNALSRRAIQEAESQHGIAVAELKELEARLPRLERERHAQQQRVNALQRQRTLLIDEQRAATSAHAQVAAAQVRYRQAQLHVQAAELRLERMTIKAPISGRILALVAAPGARVMGLDPGGEHRSSTVVTLYDPGQLQVRADVRLEDVPLVQPSQRARIETPAVKGVLDGQVLQITSRANIQKNTLEVKVGILSPPAGIRPDMLVTTTFLAPATESPDSDEAAPVERLLVPRPLIESPGDRPWVWVATPDLRAEQRTIQVGKAGTEQLVEVLRGLAPTDRLIVGGRESLAAGDRLTITEDTHFGLPDLSRR